MNIHIQELEPGERARLSTGDVVTVIQHGPGSTLVEYEPLTKRVAFEAAFHTPVSFTAQQRKRLPISRATYCERIGEAQC